MSSLAHAGEGEAECAPHLVPFSPFPPCGEAPFGGGFKGVTGMPHWCCGVLSSRARLPPTAPLPLLPPAPAGGRRFFPSIPELAQTLRQGPLH